MVVVVVMVMCSIGCRGLKCRPGFVGGQECGGLEGWVRLGGGGCEWVGCVSCLRCCQHLERRKGRVGT